MAAEAATSRTYERPRAAGGAARGGLKRVPKAKVGSTVQDFVDFDNARAVTATSADGVLFDVVRVA